MPERKNGEFKKYLWSSVNNQVCYTEISSNGKVKKIFEAKGKDSPGISDGNSFALDLQACKDVYDANKDSTKSKEELGQEGLKLAAKRAFELHGNVAVEVKYEKAPPPAPSLLDRSLN